MCNNFGGFGFHSLGEQIKSRKDRMAVNDWVLTYPVLKRCPDLNSNLSKSCWNRKSCPRPTRLLARSTWWAPVSAVLQSSFFLFHHPSSPLHHTCIQDQVQVLVWTFYSLTTNSTSQWQDGVLTWEGYGWVPCTAGSSPAHTRDSYRPAPTTITVRYQLMWENIQVFCLKRILGRNFSPICSPGHSRSPWWSGRDRMDR